MKHKKSLDILFIPPLIGKHEFSSIVRNISIGILVLLSSLRKNHFNASIFTSSILLRNDADFQSLSNDILLLKPRIVGFSTWCQNFPFILRLAQIIKHQQPEVHIICGGPHISVVGKETLEICSAIDYILVGEADHSLSQLLKAVLNKRNEKINSIPGLIYRNQNGEIQENPKLLIEKNLDNLPIPAYHELDKNSGVRIDAGRGCPFRCSYCSTNLFFSRSYRIKSPERILREMDYCHKHLGETSFCFAHDMLVLNKKYIHSLCEKIRCHREKTGRNYTWTCSARTDCLSVELLDNMSGAGCKAIFYGVESGSKKIQKQINKNLDLEFASKIIAETAKRNIKSVVSFMAGFPDESIDDLEASLKLIVRLTSEGAWPQMTLLSVLPGTPIFKKYKDILQYDEIYSGFSNTYLTEEEIKLIKDYPSIFSSFYTLPNKNFTRARLDLISMLVNYLSDFIPTIRLLNSCLERDLKTFNIYNYIDKNIGSFIDDSDLVEPEYFFLVESIKKYILLLDKQDISQSIWDVFRVDCIKAFLRIRYHQDQSIKINFGSNKLNQRIIHVNNDFRYYPHQEAIKLDYNISPTLKLDFNLKEPVKFQRKVHYYLIINKNGKQSNVHPISAQDFKALNIIRKENIPEKLKSLKLPDNMVEKFLRIGALNFF